MKDKQEAIKGVRKLIWLCLVTYFVVATYYVTLLTTPGMKGLVVFYSVLNYFLVPAAILAATVGLITAFVVLKKVRSDDIQEESHFPLPTSKERFRI